MEQKSHETYPSNTDGMDRYLTSKDQYLTSANTGLLLVLVQVFFTKGPVKELVKVPIPIFS